MKPNDLFSAFKEGSLLPLYYFYGEDQYLLDLAVQCVEKRGGFEVHDALSYDIYYGGLTPLVTILESARSLPFLGSKKLVLVKEAQEISDFDHEKLLVYCNKPSIKNTVVFVERLVRKRGWQLKKASFGKKLLEAFKKQGMVLSIPQANRSEALLWIRYLVEAQGKTIANDGTTFLHDLVGESIQDLAAAVEKAALFVGEEKNITRTAVEQTVSRLRVDSVFKLADYIGKGRREQAMEALGSLLENNAPPLFILSMITRHFRHIFTAQILLDQGASLRELQKALKVPDFEVKNLIPQARAFSRTRLQTCYEHLWRTDWSFKSTGTPQKVLLEKLVLDLCG